jgi:hypothetical protein
MDFKYLYNKEHVDIDKIDENLYMSDVFTAENIVALNERKITHILTVTGHVKPRFPDQFWYKIIEIDDLPGENMK